MTRLTSQELELLRSEGNWKALWAAAVPWVKFAASSLRTDEREDLIQDGLLKVGKAIKQWKPELGRFSTFVCHVARQAMLDHIRNKNTRLRPANEFNDMAHDEGENFYPQPQPTYADTGFTPEGFADPVTELAREFSRDAAETLLTELKASDSLLLREYLGLPTFDDPPEAMSVKDIETRMGLSQSTVSMRILRAQKSMRDAQTAREYTDTTMNIYSPPGRERMPSYQSAASRHPGFWSMGLAAAMGDIDAWRESVGSVWKDWSWKPSDLDISNGAKP